MFKTHTHNTHDISGTSLQGHIAATYKELADLFGKPLAGCNKTDAEWIVEFDDGPVATIYNYKDGVNYCGKQGTPTEKITNWHVGGLNAGAACKVQVALDLFREGSLKGGGKAKAKKKNVIEDVTDAREEMLESIKAHHGEEFAQVALILHMSHRLMDIVNVLVSMTQGEHRPPEAIALLTREAAADMAAQMVYQAARLGKLTDKGDGSAKELVKWADKLGEAEKSAVGPLLQEILSKRGE